MGLLISYTTGTNVNEELSVTSFYPSERTPSVRLSSTFHFLSYFPQSALLLRTGKVRKDTLRYNGRRSEGLESQEGDPEIDVCLLFRWNLMIDLNQWCISKLSKRLRQKSQWLTNYLVENKTRGRTKISTVSIIGLREIDTFTSLNEVGVKKCSCHYIGSYSVLLVDSPRSPTVWSPLCSL